MGHGLRTLEARRCVRHHSLGGRSFYLTAGECDAVITAKDEWNATEGQLDGALAFLHKIRP